MFKKTSRLAIVAAVVSISFAVSAAPSQALVATTGSITVTGTATCNADTGHPTWTLHWTITNTIAVVESQDPLVTSPISMGVDTANESGLVTADIKAAVTPNPIPADGSSTATDGPVPNAVGDITLTVEWSTEGPSGTSVGTIHLDGSCVLTEPTTTQTTAPPAAKAAVAAQPAFTG
jgi:hypothetical protein